jgi:hypothetical protein
MRRVTERDELYRYLAQELAEPSICEKIPWSVLSPGGFFLSPSYERSDCYTFIAGRTKNPWICWRVKRLGAFHLFSQQTSLWSCVNDALRGMNAGVAVPQASLVRFFGELGYDPDTIHMEGITPPVVSVKDLYRQISKEPDIVARIAQATRDFEKSQDSAKSEDPPYLADMAALPSKDPGWCNRDTSGSRARKPASPIPRLVPVYTRQ